MLRKKWDVVIVGGGIAGYTAAAAVLAEDFSAGELEIQSADWYRQHDLGMRINSRAVAVDPGNRILILDDGEQFSWHNLILATGAAAVIPRIPGFREGILQGRTFNLRNAQEAERLRAAALGRKFAVVVGAGVLGVEVVEQLWKLGLRVTLVEKMNRVMPADLDGPASTTLEGILRSRGVELRLRQNVQRLKVDRPEYVTVVLEGEEIRGDIVVFCVGTVPRTELAVKAGLAVEKGIKVDRYLRTSHPHIFAAGDAAQQADGRITHLWYAAEHQGELAGANVCGAELHYPNSPFRLKMEVFQRYFFSMNWSGGDSQKGQGEHKVFLRRID